jgi:hypothetical protein
MNTPHCAQYCKNLINYCGGGLQNNNYNDKNVIIFPGSLKEEIIEAAHRELLLGQMEMSKSK